MTKASSSTLPKTVLYTLIALIAFAGNSVLCRLALNENIIDAASFTSIRLFSGAIFLLVLVFATTKQGLDLKKKNWPSAFYLFLYASAFSFAYITLDTGAGALILFGVVQVTMICVGILKGKKLLLVEWIGLFVAFLGLVILLLPGSSAPSLLGFALMSLSGLAWGFYTLAGQGSKTPLVDTANNFLKTLPFVAVLMLFTLNDVQLSSQGVLLAVVSGAITSGLGYAIWYLVLTLINVTHAAILQLSVPIIAAFGGVIFAGERITIQLTLSSVLVLGGVLIVILGKQYFTEKTKV